MTEREKAAAGYLYDPGNEPELADDRARCKDLCFSFNQCKPSEFWRQREILRMVFGKTEGDFTITQPFWCDYGYNITLGNRFYANHNLVILDGAKVTVGDDVFIAPNCVISTAGHAFDAEQRNQGLEIALPVAIGNSVWIGANVTVLPGVTIGDNVIIGAGSVVTEDIPSGVIAAGNPCRVIREITDEDKNKYPVLQE